LGTFGASWGFITRTGDARAAVMPDWSHDGKTIVYTSADQIAGGHVGGLNAGDGKTPLTTPTESDIYTVPFNAKAGGAATPVAGAATAGIAEYYPDFSADDQLIAYTRVGNTNGYFYYRADGEIMIVPTAGGTATRLAANDPPACSGQTSPGVLNSWPKWSPSVETDAAGNKYYFLVFSSARKYDEQFMIAPNQYTPPGLDARSSQMYLAAITVSPAGVVTSYPASYIWNQTPSTSNLTPAWDEFKIPEVVVK
jgi:Tol biopolymer transport system component